MTGQAAGDAFRALGLEPRPDLTDDQVHAAWRRIASATHPDREDGGDPERFAEAAAAYTVLRTRFGRGEVLADLTARPAETGSGGRRPVMARWHDQRFAAVTSLPARVRRGRAGAARAADRGRGGGRHSRRGRRRPASGRSRPGYRRGDLAGADRPARPGPARGAPRGSTAEDPVARTMPPGAAAGHGRCWIATATFRERNQGWPDLSGPGNVQRVSRIGGFGTGRGGGSAPLPANAARAG